MIKIEIDGTIFDVDEGKTVLEASKENNIDIPTLCYHKALSPYGACRLCVVEILNEKGSQLTASCTYPVTEGVKVLTKSEKVNKNCEKNYKQRSFFNIHKLDW